MTLSVFLPFALALAAIVPAHAADLQVIAGGGIAGALNPIAAEFEKTSGHKVAIRHGTTPELIAIAKSSIFDAVVLPREFLNDAEAAAKLAGATVDVARVGLGVAVRAGAPKPDIASPEALKQALLEAKSVGTVPASAAGAQVMKLFERLGVEAPVKDKLQAALGPAKLVEAVAAGQAELGLFLINVLTAPGLDVVGPVPASLDQQIVYTTGTARDAAQAELARAFIAFLQTPGAKALIKSRGLTPA
ncbi:MAG: substrate-binding domain-containing protein [Reyranella sp.]|uniref:molybdate ABC transporter substrate-binding protein n=1 Tax=Reyranella sp. TaxID=1929291 RepID=UPI001AC04E4A|nr:substrate-binding domain-containing protein [Reyranella sp.]MBN9091509.1 substrate-binding domain-containing protein [Reyranella sp.]